MIGFRHTNEREEEDGLIFSLAVSTGNLADTSGKLYFIVSQGRQNVALGGCRLGDLKKE